VSGSLKNMPNGKLLWIFMRNEIQKNRGFWVWVYGVDPDIRPKSQRDPDPDSEFRNHN